MIIRSQDKCIIVNFNNIDTIDTRDKQVRYFANGGVETMGVLGTYSTEEKATKVLDMIQSAYVELNLNYPQYVANGYFEMPQDSEV